MRFKSLILNTLNNTQVYYIYDQAIIFLLTLLCLLIFVFYVLVHVFYGFYDSVITIYGGSTNKAFAFLGRLLTRK